MIAIRFLKIQNEWVVFKNDRFFSENEMIVFENETKNYRLQKRLTTLGLLGSCDSKGWLPIV